MESLNHGIGTNILFLGSDVLNLFGLDMDYIGMIQKWLVGQY